MTTILIILALIALAVGVAVWATRRKPEPDAALRQLDQDTGWNDPITPADDAADPFAGAPKSDGAPR